MDVKTVVNTLDLCGVSYETLDLGDGWQIIVTRQGGHVYGPYSKKFPEGIFWTPDALEDVKSFQKLVEERNWNIGGDRVWIAPEIQFNITDRRRFRETLNQPKTMDPGDYQIRKENNIVYLHQSLDLESYNTVEGTAHLDFGRKIMSAPNPLRKLGQFKNLMEGVSYCGYEQVMDLQAESKEDIYAESWGLLQIRPKGKVFIPMYTAERGTDHYEPAREHEILTESGICLHITGNSRYKIAYKAACLTGRFGYLADSDTDESYLIVINYPNDPSALYSEEPPLKEGDTGYSVHIYNDDGNSGGFAELECNMPTIGRPTGLGRSVDRMSRWIFAGNKTKLGEISKCLLGKDIGKFS